MPEPPVDESEPGPPRPLSDFMSPDGFAEFNAETRRLKSELARAPSSGTTPALEVWVSLLGFDFYGARR